MAETTLRRTGKRRRRLATIARPGDRLINDLSAPPSEPVRAVLSIHEGRAPLTNVVAPPSESEPIGSHQHQSMQVEAGTAVGGPSGHSGSLCHPGQAVL